MSSNNAEWPVIPSGDLYGLSNGDLLVESTVQIGIAVCGISFGLNIDHINHGNLQATAAVAFRSDNEVL